MPNTALKWTLPPFAFAAFLIYLDSAFAMPWLSALAFIFLFFGMFVVLFFRDPERAIGKGVVSPADGKIVRIQSGKKTRKISIFMNIYNVHVNRAPISGKIIHMRHRPGSHIPAFRKDSDRNERVITVIESEIGTVKVTQIAGALARRIIPYVTAGDSLRKGERLGLICFGSRVDLVIPKSYRLRCSVGQITLAGTTTLAEAGK
jgi:phosphatidylserine decarboxylase